jgi:hypothetical protein
VADGKGVPSPAAAASRIASVLESRDDWNDNFSVVDDEMIRIVGCRIDDRRQRLGRGSG